jgi:hypothetical protein
MLAGYKTHEDTKITTPAPGVAPPASNRFLLNLLLDSNYDKPGDVDKQQVEEVEQYKDMGASSTTALPSVVPHKSPSRRNRRIQMDRSLSPGVKKSIVDYSDSE